MGWLEETLVIRKKEHRLRSLNHSASFVSPGKITLNDREYLDFSSNDYLGLANHPALKEAAAKAVRTWGTGGRASRLLSGDSELHHELEDKVARFKGKESALVFNSGYQANVGIISALCKKGDVVFSDRLNHASIIDGIRLSAAKLLRFSHNDPKHLKTLLESERGKFKKALIITETVFSMDGDRPPLTDFVALKERYDCQIMVDEAHATGIFGKNGSGVVEEAGLSDKVDLIMGTFSKALGSFGAYLAGDKMIKDYLINTCRSFIYSTALPPGVIAASLASLDVIRDEPWRRRELLENAGFFRQRLKARGLEVRGSTQIVPLIIGEGKRAINISQKLQELGSWVLPIRPPTVPAREARLRFSLTVSHSKDILESLVADIGKLYQV